MANLNEQKGTMNDALNQKEAVFLRHKKTISIAIVAIILVVAGIICYETYISGPREQEASTALAKGQEYFSNQQYDKALKGDGAGYTGFVNIASDYSSTDAGNLANLYAGLCYANLDKWNDAVTYLDKFSPSDDQMISPSAVAALGNAYAHVKQLDKAVEYLKKLQAWQTAKLKTILTTAFRQSSLFRQARFSKARAKRAKLCRSIRILRRNILTLPFRRILTNI